MELIRKPTIQEERLLEHLVHEEVSTQYGLGTEQVSTVRPYNGDQMNSSGRLNRTGHI